MRRIKPRRGLILVVLVVLIAAACSDGESSGSGPSAPPSSGGGSEATACDPEAAAPPEAEAVEGSTSDLDVTSFDGTTIRTHWFPRDGASADEPAPTVLMGPGWSLPGDTAVDAVGVFGALNISALHDAGFNVLTWDPRGFGASGGTATVNSEDHEGRDVQALLDWVADRPEAELDAAGDPRAGMIGGSYGGGIQLTTAGIDCRVDAIVPILAWHSLETSLYKAETPKAGWANLLAQVAGTASVDPHITSANEAMATTGSIDEEDADWFIDRGPGDLVGDVAVPTLLVQGTVDTLFTLDEARTNYEILRDNGVPVGMVWFCGGHGTCLTDQEDQAHIGDAALTWLRRHLFEDPSIETGPAIDLIDQNGDRYTADDYPLPLATPITASGSGELQLVEEGGSGPPTEVPDGPGDFLRDLVLPITPSRADNAVDVAIAVPDVPTLVVGAPQLSLTYEGTAPDGERPARVFAQLVDDATGLVLGNQTTPIEITLDGQFHTTSVPLEIISYATTPGSGLTLQLVATTVTYAEPRLGGTINFDDIEIMLPVADGITPGQP